MPPPSDISTWSTEDMTTYLKHNAPSVKVIKAVYRWDAAAYKEATQYVETQLRSAGFRPTDRITIQSLASHRDAADRQAVAAKPELFCRRQNQSPNERPTWFHQALYVDGRDDQSADYSRFGLTMGKRLQSHVWSKVVQSNETPTAQVARPPIAGLEIWETVVVHFTSVSYDGDHLTLQPRHISARSFLDRDLRVDAWTLLLKELEIEMDTSVYFYWFGADTADAQWAPLSILGLERVLHELFRGDLTEAINIFVAEDTTEVNMLPVHRREWSSYNEPMLWMELDGRISNRENNEEVDEEDQLD